MVHVRSTSRSVYMRIVRILKRVKNAAQLLVLLLLKFVQAVIIEGFIPEFFAMVVVLQERVNILNTQTIKEIRKITSGILDVAVLLLGREEIYYVLSLFEQEQESDSAKKCILTIRELGPLD